MRSPRYDSYKDSGSDWIGRVPAHWKVDRLKWSTIDCRNGTWGSEPLGNADDVVCVRVADFDRVRLRVDLSEPTMRSVTESERKGRSLMIGDLLLEKSGGGEMQPVGCVVSFDHPVEAVCSNFVARMTIAKETVSRYWCYVHAAAYALRVNVRSIKQTSGIQNLDQAQYLDERAPFPPSEEQVAIADFLDHETARIDALIAEQERLIDLLQEKRQAVISHAVTMGLDPDVPMKASGIEWLGAVPEHWKIAKLKHISPRITVGIVVEPSKHYSDEGVPALRSLNVSRGRIVLDNLVYITEQGHTMHAKSRLCAGDLVVVRSGQPGSAAVVPPDLEGCNCIDLLIIRKPEADFEQWLLWFLGSDVARAQFVIGSGGAIQQHLNASSLADVVVPVPPIEEQRKIAFDLNDRTAAFDRLISEASLATQLLLEHRSALISAAVTGQIDVRGLVPEAAA